MIARAWTGSTPEEKSDRYLEYLKQTGLKQCQSTTGNRGVFILRRVVGGRAEFLFISLWESLEAIKSFAGPDIDKAVYYPADREFLLDMESLVRHYEVAVAPRPAGEDPAC